MSRLFPRCDYLTTLILSVAGILAAVVAVGEAASPKPSSASEPVLEFKVESPKEPVSLQVANSRRFIIPFKIRNISDQKVIVWPFLDLELIGPDGKVVHRALNRGRFGFSAGSLIESISFYPVAPGETHEIRINLNLYEYDLMALTGWRIEERGTYTLKMRYEFDRKAAKKELGKGCKDLDNARKPWNRAIEAKKVVSIKLKVK